MAGQEIGLEPVKVFTDLSNKISAARLHFEEYSSGVSKLLKLKNPTPRPPVSKPGKARPKQGTTASIPQPATLAGPAGPTRALPSTAQVMAGTSLGQSMAGRQSGSPPPMPGGSTTATTSGDPVLALSLSSSVDGGADSAAAPSLVPVQLMQHQPATDVLGAPSTSSSEQASSRQLKDAPLLQVNRAQLSRSSSQIVSSPTVIQPGAKPVHAWSTDAMSYPSAAVAAATAATPEGLPLFGDAVLALPGSHFSAHSLSTVAALNPQESGTPDLLAAVNAVAGRLSLRHTASQSSHAGLPSISEASVAAHGDMPAALAQQQGGAATGVNGSPQGLMFSSAASGYRRTISNLRTGGSVTASMAADMPRVASLTRQTSQGIQLPAYQLPGLGGGTAQTDIVDWQS
ncbi:hypothetical protein ABBQ32_010888 [Trebouxia sp. C0010 RCD-2024]